MAMIENFWATFALPYFPSTTLPLMKFPVVWPRSDDCPNYIFHRFGATLKFLWAPQLVEANFTYVAGGMGSGLMNFFLGGGRNGWKL